MPPAVLAELQALAARMKPADTAEYAGIKVECKRDQVMFTVTLAAAGKKEKAA
jgi:hypothetical protein